LSEWSDLISFISKYFVRNLVEMVSLIKFKILQQFEGVKDKSYLKD